MKKILAQLYGYKSGIGGSGTIQDYREIYKVPEPENPDEYSDKIFVECCIYVFANSTNNNNANTETTKTNYNIRIIRDGDPIDPRLQPQGDATNGDEAQEFKNKGVLLNNPTTKTSDYPVKYDNIMLQTGDSIVVQILDPGITIQIFGEELQYDTDAYFKMMNTNLTILNNNLTIMNGILDQRRQTSHTDLQAIKTSIDNIDCSGGTTDSGE